MWVLNVTQSLNVSLKFVLPSRTACIAGLAVKSGSGLNRGLNLV